jgi:predicted S18 family serine protease
MTFAHLSSIFEHLNYQRKIIGFDTFEGFPTEPSKFDDKEYGKKGYLNVNSFDDIQSAIKLYDLNRFLNHEPKVKLVQGDICNTVPKFLEDNPQTLVSLLYIDVDLYEPTKVILENFLPRMARGSVLVFLLIHE